MSTALVLSILFLSAFVRAALGFGDALLAMPLLTLLLGLETAAPLTAFAAPTIALTMLVGEWRGVDWRATWRLIVSSLAGIPIGMFFLQAAPEPAVKAVLAVVLVAFGLYGLIAPRLPALRGEGLAYPFGFVAGVLGGAYNTNGPPVVVYAALRQWPPEPFRATLQSYFLPTGLMILVGHGLAGSWTPTVLRLYGLSVPVILLAVFAGLWVGRRIPAGRFHRLVYAALVAMGGLLLL